MAVVSYKDADGVEHWADEHSKAYEKHLKSQKTVRDEPKGEFRSPEVKPEVKPVEPKKL